MGPAHITGPLWGGGGGARVARHVINIRLDDDAAQAPPFPVPPRFNRDPGTATSTRYQSRHRSFLNFLLPTVVHVYLARPSPIPCRTTPKYRPPAARPRPPHHWPNPTWKSGSAEPGLRKL